MTVRGRANTPSGATPQAARGRKATLGNGYSPRVTWPVDPRGGADRRESSDPEETHARAPVHPGGCAEDRAATVLAALARAGDAETPEACLDAVLAALMIWCAASAGVAWRTDPASVARLARVATPTGSVADPGLSDRLSLEPAEAIPVALTGGDTRWTVRTLAITHHADTLATVCLAFARTGAAEEPLAPWLLPAACLALRTGLAVAEARRERSRRAAAVRRLAESEARTRAVLSSIPEPTVIADEGSQRIVYANAAAGRLLGSDEVTDTGARLPLEGQTLAQAGYHQVVGDGLHPEAAVKRVQTVLKGRVAWVLRVDDLRPAQRLRMAASRMHRDATLGQLAAGVLPEALAAEASVMTALASLRYEVMNARVGGAAGPLAACGALVEDALVAGARIRRALAGLVRVNADTPVPVAVDVVPVAEAVLSSLGPQLSALAAVMRGLQAVPEARATPGGLALVLVHLLTNAAHAVSDGRPHTLSVRTQADAEWVALTVADDGCGIPASQMASVFEPFQSSRRGARGIGLGLSVSRDLVTRWGGRIELESTVGQGTTVRVILRRA